MIVPKTINSAIWNIRIIKLDTTAAEHFRLNTYIHVIKDILYMMKRRRKETHFIYQQCTSFFEIYMSKKKSSMAKKAAFLALACYLYILFKYTTFKSCVCIYIVSYLIVIKYLHMILKTRCTAHDYFATWPWRIWYSH